jgi:hypothetical protein
MRTLQERGVNKPADSGNGAEQKEAVQAFFSA